MEGTRIQSLKCPSCGAPHTELSKTCEFCKANLSIYKIEDSANCTQNSILKTQESEEIGFFRGLEEILMGERIGWQLTGGVIIAICSFIALSINGEPFYISLLGLMASLVVGFFWIQIFTCAFILGSLYLVFHYIQN